MTAVGPYRVQAGKPGARRASVEQCCLDAAEAERVRQKLQAALPDYVVRIRVDEPKPERAAA